MIIATANDGIKAIDYIRHKKPEPEIVVVDIEMPIFDGLSTTDFITSFHNNIKVIAVSTHFEKSLIDELIASKAIGFLNKPNIVTISRTPYNEILDIGGLAKNALSNCLDAAKNNEPYVDLRLRYDLSTREHLINNKMKKRNDFFEKYGISSREKELIALAHPHINNSTISSILNISNRTVETHFASLAKKLNVQYDKIILFTFVIYMRLITLLVTKSIQTIKPSKILDGFIVIDVMHLFQYLLYSSQFTIRVNTFKHYT